MKMLHFVSFPQCFDVVLSERFTENLREDPFSCLWIDTFRYPNGNGKLPIEHQNYYVVCDYLDTHCKYSKGTSRKFQATIH